MTILVQGAVDFEIDVLLAYYQPKEVKTIAGHDFYVADYKSHKIIISKTAVGLINASVATTIGISTFQPALVINQGCAGGHVPEIKKGDLIIGEKSVYINNFKTKAKKLGEGSNSLEWYPSSKRSYEIKSTAKYVDVAANVAFAGTRYIGTLGSGDMFSKEVDRINYLHNLFGELSEDMESVAAMKVSDDFKIDKIALRIISNNEITNGEFDTGVCATLQKFVITFVDKVLLLTSH